MIWWMSQYNLNGGTAVCDEYTKGNEATMKILMISPEPFFEPRGTPISVYQRIEALTALGYEVDLVTYHVGKDVAFPNLTIHRVTKIGMIKHVRIGASRAKLFLDVLIFFKALGLLLNNRYDVIHTHEEAAFFGVFLGWLFRVPHIYDMHSILSKQLSSYKISNFPVFIRTFEILERLVFKTVKAIITVGSDLENHVISQGLNTQVVMIENIALQAYKKAVQPEDIRQLVQKLDLEGRLPVVYAGTYEQYQGLAMALESIREVSKQYPNVIFIFVGAKNTQAAEWTKRARELNVQNHAMFLDVVSPEESMVFLAAAAVLISPRFDGTTTPLKIYSYLYASKPIVATNITAHTQVLNPQIAFLVEPNKEAFAEGIIHALSDPAHAERISTKAREYALEKFNRQDYLTKVDLIYKSLFPEKDLEKTVLVQE